MRAKKDTKKSWTNNFRADLYQHHHKGEHPSKWEHYQTCSYEEKVNYFKQKPIMKSSMFHHLQPNYTPVHFIINRDIVDVLICDMFFHPDDHGGVTQTATKNLFHQFEDVYRVTLFNPMQFRLVVAQIARGVSFRQVVGIISDTKAITGIWNLCPR